MRFTIGKSYSSDALFDAFGGNRQASLPLYKGSVALGRFARELNPNMPQEVWIEEGKDRERAARLFARLKEGLPIFEKCGSQTWVFKGWFRVKELHDASSNPNLLSQINRKPPRSPVAIALELEPVGCGDVFETVRGEFRKDR